jgi:4a-hydroxytetrahydrobiopterin dehydratase
MKRTLLTEEEIVAALTTLEGWSVEGNELVKTFRFTSYLVGIDFVSRLGHAAEAMNHHPDLLVGWRKVTMRVSTHSAGGLTELDVALAREADRIAA